ncbi:MAG TPA: PKD domain-containing protein [Williamwhitmania sp.]|nr:PKD domain-containing protein [Williamwhitmania sp.]
MKKAFFFLISLTLLIGCNKEQEYRKLKVGVGFSVGDTLIMVGEKLDIKNTSDSISVNYYWDFGDGQYSTNKNPIYAYDNPGLYTIKLKVFDISGNSDSVKHNIRVGERYVYELELFEIYDHKYFNTVEYWDEDSLGINALPDIYFVFTGLNDMTPQYITKTIYNVSQNDLPINYQIPNIKISPFGFEVGWNCCGIFLYDKDGSDSEEMMSNWMSGVMGYNYNYNKTIHKGEFTIGLFAAFKVKFLIK